MSTHNPEIIEFTVLGRPMAQPRHRDYTLPNGARVQVDPAKKDKQNFLAVAQSHAPDAPYDVPLAMDLILYFPRPKSHFRSGARSDELKPSAPDLYAAKGRNDVDNCLKFVLDALNGVYYVDDGLIVHALVVKLYGRPRTVVRIEPAVDTFLSDRFGWLEAPSND